MATAIAVPPRPVMDTINSIKRHAVLGAGIESMMERKDRFDSTLAAQLAGIAVMPLARKQYDDALDSMWSRISNSNRFPTGSNPSVEGVDEIVIGAGLHAAIYCAARVASGHPKPLVIEASDRVGGALAVTNSATFFLNSRNRPGRLAAPGDGGALNVLPGAPIQPADLSHDEYQRNSDLGFVIRTTLAMYADVRTNMKIVSIQRNYSQPSTPKRRTYALTLAAPSKRVLYADRVIVATGLGQSIGGRNKRNVMNFMDFMRHMAQPFPFRGMKRIGVIGAGDGGKTVIEALTGQGPNDHWSMPSFDYIEKIEWWDQALANGPTRSTYEACVRSRYKGIGRMLPRDSEDARVLPVTRNASYIEGGYDLAYIDDKPYDLVIDCRGYRQTEIDGFTPDSLAAVEVGGRPVARGASSIFTVGPMAVLQVRGTLGDSKAIPENATALYRYAERTASLAADLS